MCHVHRVYVLHYILLKLAKPVQSPEERKLESDGEEIKTQPN